MRRTVSVMLGIVVYQSLACPYDCLQFQPPMDGPGPAIVEPDFGAPEPAPAPDIPSDEPATEHTADATATPEGGLVLFWPSCYCKRRDSHDFI